MTYPSWTWLILVLFCFFSAMTLGFSSKSQVLREMNVLVHHFTRYNWANFLTIESQYTRLLFVFDTASLSGWVTWSNNVVTSGARVNIDWFSIFFNFRHKTAKLIRCFFVTDWTSIYLPVMSKPSQGRRHVDFLTRPFLPWFRQFE